MKTIIKNNDNSKAVNKRREDVNSEQVENSQSKAVRSKKDIIKQYEEKATYRDYSGKIRFGDSEKPVPDDTKPEKSGKAFDKVKKAKQAERRKELIRPEITAAIVKAENTTEVVKPADSVDIVKPQYSTPQYSQEATVDIDSPAYKKALKKQLKQYTSNKSAVNMPKTQLDVSDMPQGIIKTETQAAVIEHRSGVDDVISTSQAYPQQQGIWLTERSLIQTVHSVQSCLKWHINGSWKLCGVFIKMKAKLIPTMPPLNTVRTNSRRKDSSIPKWLLNILCP